MSGPPQFDNSYAALPDKFYTKLAPTQVVDPTLIRLNRGLAAQMGLDENWLGTEDGLAMLSGNQMPEGAMPLAQVYAGHQFGGWSGQLGDGRANLLGEVQGPDGQHWDIQLKGSGPTPYSRMGDGRSALGPVLREYIVSEAMAALGVPTTRALAAVTTGEIVLRDRREPGAILTRVAPSHIRVGTFQFFAANQDLDALKTLTEFTIARHYPDADDALGLLKAVIRAQAKLVAHWMSLGFIHGVMNTDNTHMGGLTIDYGPCAFMDTYHPAKVFSSIDQFGRYAYQAQPEILVWNLAQLATSLLPLIDTDDDKAVEAAKAALQDYGPAYSLAWQSRFAAKIGIANPVEDDIALVQDILTKMADNLIDFTLFFRVISQDDPTGARDLFVDPTAFDTWAENWKKRAPDAVLMRATNPALIPRNHQIQAAIEAGNNGIFAPFHRLTEALQDPFSDRVEIGDLQAPPREEELVHQTFCGT